MAHLSSRVRLSVFLVLIISIGCSSCNLLSKKSDKLIGEWVRHYSSYTKGYDIGQIRISGFSISWENTWLLEKEGTGKVRIKTITIWDDKNMSNTSYTIEHPIKWEIAKNENGDFLVKKFGAGKIVEIVFDDRLREEQNALTSVNLYNGMSDTTSFKIEPDDTVKWYYKGSNEKLDYAKRF